MTQEERRKIENEWIAWERDMNRQLTGTQYKVVFLPTEDLMPYSHVGICTELSDRMMLTRETQEETEDTVYLQLDDEEESATVEMALTVYKAALMAIHGERLRAELKDAAEGGKHDGLG